MLKLTLLAGLGGHWAQASAASAPTDHHMLQRSLEDRAWALNTRSILDNFSTCEGCQVRVLAPPTIEAYPPFGLLSAFPSHPLTSAGRHAEHPWRLEKRRRRQRRSPHYSRISVMRNGHSRSCFVSSLIFANIFVIEVVR